MYVPILNDKQAEFHAIADLTGTGSIRTQPLVDFRNPEPPRTASSQWTPEAALRSRLVDPGKGLVGCWGGGPVSIDLGRVNAKRFDRHYAELDLFFEYCADLGLEAVPVTSRDRSPEYRSVAARAVRRLQHGACVRLRGRDLGAGTAGVIPLLRELDLPRASVDLVFDLSVVPTDNLFLTAKVTRAMIDQFLPLNEWRSLALCGGAFPNDLSGIVEYESYSSVIRAERDVFRVANMESTPVDIAFGDYGPVHAAPVLGFRGAANIRYAERSDWLVLRGPHRDKASPSDFLTLAEQLMSLDNWRGADHCPGCLFVASQVEAGAPGNPTQWRSADFSHHFAVVHEDRSGA